MELKILISTPKGCASKTESKLRSYIIGKTKAKINLYTNPEDNKIIWEMEGTPKECLKASRNVNLFDSVIKSVFSNKLILKAVDKKDIPELEDMLKNHTTVEIIKQATQDEKDENNKTWWERVKEKFTKKTI